jgi:predicted N-acetyltransferase YhbS
MFEITAEGPEDASAIERLLDETFGRDRHAKPSYRYRDGVDPERRLCLVAREGGRVGGATRHWPVVIGEGATPALLLGPVAVAVDRRGRGVGRALVRRGLEGAAALGHRIVLLVSDLDYYRRFGFRPAAPGIVMPGERPERLLAAELVRGALDGERGIIRPAGAGSCVRSGVLTPLGPRPKVVRRSDAPLGRAG